MRARVRVRVSVRFGVRVRVLASSDYRNTLKALYTWLRSYWVWGSG